MGLANLGCTCYMASCMQQLHMVPSLTAGLLRAHPSEAKRYAPMFEQLQQLLDARADCSCLCLVLRKRLLMKSDC